MLWRSSLLAEGLTGGRTTSILPGRLVLAEPDGRASADSDGTGVVTLLVRGVVYSLLELYEAGVGADDESEFSSEALLGRPLGRLGLGSGFIDGDETVE